MNIWFERAKSCDTPQTVREAIREMVEHCETLAGKPDPDYGFAHIVLADYNLSDGFINDCLRIDNLHAFLERQMIAILKNSADDTDRAALMSGLLESVAITIDFLLGLRYVPESIREAVTDELR